MNEEQFAQKVLPVLNGIFEMQGRPAPSLTTVVLWTDALARFDADVAVAALKEYLTRPDVHYGPLQPHHVALLIEGQPEERAVRAWQKFLQAVRDKSGYASISFDDPAIHATVKHMGGWIKLTGELDDDNREKLRREFEQNYRAFVAHGVPADTPLHLTGMVEDSHLRYGKPFAGPLQLVGDPALAALVAAGEHPALRAPAAPTAALPAPGARGA